MRISQTKSMQETASFATPAVTTTTKAITTHEVAPHKNTNAEKHWLRLHNNVEPVQKMLRQHPIYHSVGTPEALRVFCQMHVFAVWDFMSLLKRLQRDLTCTTLPWQPPNPRLARLINEIVLGEESDWLDGDAQPTSHFDLYREAMHEIGADTKPIARFIDDAMHMGWENALSQAQHHEKPAIQSALQFTSHTLHTAIRASTAAVAGAFFFGREDIIPAMFSSAIDGIRQSGQEPKRLLQYLERHVEVDGNDHGPRAKELLLALCGDDEKLWKEAETAAISSCQARVALWDAVCMAITAENI